MISCVFESRRGSNGSSKHQYDIQIVVWLMFVKLGRGENSEKEDWRLSALFGELILHNEGQADHESFEASDIYVEFCDNPHSATNKNLEKHEKKSRNIWTLRRWAPDLAYHSEKIGSCFQTIGKDLIFGINATCENHLWRIKMTSIGKGKEIFSWATHDIEQMHFSIVDILLSYPIRSNFKVCSTTFSPEGLYVRIQNGHWLRTNLCSDEMQKLVYLKLRGRINLLQQEPAFCITGIMSRMLKMLFGPNF